MRGTYVNDVETLKEWVPEEFDLKCGRFSTSDNLWRVEFVEESRLEVDHVSGAL